MSPMVAICAVGMETGRRELDDAALVGIGVSDVEVVRRKRRGDLVTKCPVRLSGRAIASGSSHTPTTWPLCR